MVGDRRYVPVPDRVGKAMVQQGRLDVPLLATDAEPHAVVLGTRRAAALKAHLGANDEIPILVASKSSEVLAWLAADRRAHPDGGLPWSWVQRARVYGWLTRDISTRNGQPPLVAALADYLGTHEGQLRNAWYLVRDFDAAGGEKRIQLGRALQAVESGELLPQSAATRLRTAGFPDPNAPRRPPAMSAADQRRALVKLGDALTGLGMGIESLGVMHALASDDPVLVPLKRFRRDITRLVRALTPTDTQGVTE
jgi:hypothetical protein